jgi:hypothetical protein
MAPALLKRLKEYFCPAMPYDDKATFFAFISNLQCEAR